ncbi:hypothetical protein YC2023_098771 [Brassica napus]
MAASINLFFATTIFFKPSIHQPESIDTRNISFTETKTKSVKFLHPLKSNSAKLLQKANIKTTCLWNNHSVKRHFQLPLPLPSDAHTEEFCFSDGFT